MKTWRYYLILHELFTFLYLDITRFDGNFHNARIESCVYDIVKSMTTLIHLCMFLKITER